MAEDQSKSALIAELEKSRTLATKSVRALRRDVDFRTNATSAYSQNPAPWIGAAVVLGLIIAKIPARTKTVVVNRFSRNSKVGTAGKAGLALGVLKIGLDWARPAITKWVGNRVSAYMDSRHGARRPARRTA